MTEQCKQKWFLYNGEETIGRYSEEDPLKYIKSLESKLSKAIDVLKMYADKKNWLVSTEYPDEDNKLKFIVNDLGHEPALDCLKQIGEIK